LHLAEDSRLIEQPLDVLSVLAFEIVVWIRYLHYHLALKLNPNTEQPCPDLEI